MKIMDLAIKGYAFRLFKESFWESWKDRHITTMN